jgi:hypothetical protein
MSLESEGGMILTGENRRTRRKTCPSATLSTTNPTWIVPGANPGLRGERPATDDLSHGTALFDMLQYGIANQRAIMVIFTAVRSSDLTWRFLRQSYRQLLSDHYKLATKLLDVWIWNDLAKMLQSAWAGACYVKHSGSLNHDSTVVYHDKFKVAFFLAFTCFWRKFWYSTK